MLDGHDYEDNWNYELFETHMKIEWVKNIMRLSSVSLPSFIIYKGIVVRM